MMEDLRILRNCIKHVCKDMYQEWNRSYITFIWSYGNMKGKKGKGKVPFGSISIWFIVSFCFYVHDEIVILFPKIFSAPSPTRMNYLFKDLTFPILQNKVYYLTGTHGTRNFLSNSTGRWFTLTSMMMQFILMIDAMIY